MATAAWLHQSARPCSEDTIFTHTHIYIIYIYMYIYIFLIYNIYIPFIKVDDDRKKLGNTHDVMVATPPG